MGGLTKNVMCIQGSLRAVEFSGLTNDVSTLAFQCHSLLSRSQQETIGPTSLYFAASLWGATGARHLRILTQASKRHNETCVRHLFYFAFLAGGVDHLQRQCNRLLRALTHFSFVNLSFSTLSEPVSWLAQSRDVHLEQQVLMKSEMSKISMCFYPFAGDHIFHFLPKDGND
mmetsp:Transcript_48506/g.90001  ORF Transcript_48506/g.90001 Transcript_48506/m.90001 type:complete len:172 (+) Transcript_48506:474-989(+)